MPDHCRFVLLCCLALVCWCRPALAAEVVLLHSTAEPDAWTEAVGSGLRQALDGVAEVGELYPGTPLDDEDRIAGRFDEISRRWADRPVAAVVTDGPTAFAFIRKYREDLFAGAPVVYCGTPRPEPEYLRQCGECAGVPLEYAVRETVDLIYALRPETSLVAGIMDGSPKSVRLRRRLEAAMALRGREAALIFPGHEPGDDRGLDPSSLADVAMGMPGLGVVLVLSVQQDNAGNPLSVSQAVKILTEKSVAPVYVLSRDLVGAGALGGVVVRGEDQGRAAGNLVRRALVGERLGEMLAEAPSAVAVADLSVMARLGMSADALPSGAERLNALPTTKEPEGLSPAGAGVAFLAAVVLVLAYVLLRRSANGRGGRLR
ncbi:hypothetical protein GM415_05580 [Pseudodesulfovibrio cashew]|uniref:ABC transporter substrate-binding protein n=1 Tax=Pseudodesulfovibrio cashew TaxID=2678688 RepID=A0A6I6JEU9_9BACT|nr:hypothetical protein [Pseudodesulfovibrio cashew]QGY39610.1 hypothetical protein GM415_05580 [Pseudodesulfovibrio cashew]